MIVLNASRPDSDRSKVEALLRDLYAARMAGDLDRVCSLFAADALLKISGSSDGKPVAIAARGAEEIRCWLGVLVKTFRLSRQQILSVVVEGPRAAVHWRASIHSRITGASVPTELVDIFYIDQDHIASYVELLVPA